MEKIKQQYPMYIELLIAIIFIAALPFFAIFYLAIMTVYNYKFRKKSDSQSGMLVFYGLFFIVAILQTMNYFGKTGLLF